MDLAGEYGELADYRGVTLSKFRLAATSLPPLSPGPAHWAPQFQFRIALRLFRLA